MAVYTYCPSCGMKIPLLGHKCPFCHFELDRWRHDNETSKGNLIASFIIMALAIGVVILFTQCISYEEGDKGFFEKLTYFIFAATFGAFFCYQRYHYKKAEEFLQSYVDYWKSHLDTFKGDTNIVEKVKKNYKKKRLLIWIIYFLFMLACASYFPIKSYNAQKEVERQEQLFQQSIPVLEQQFKNNFVGKTFKNGNTWSSSQEALTFVNDRILRQTNYGGKSEEFEYTYEVSQSKGKYVFKIKWNEKSGFMETSWFETDLINPSTNDLSDNKKIVVIKMRNGYKDGGSTELVLQ